MGILDETPWGKVLPKFLEDAGGNIGEFFGNLGGSSSGPNPNGLENLYGGRVPTLGGHESVQKAPAQQRYTQMFSPNGQSPFNTTTAGRTPSSSNSSQRLLDVLNGKGNFTTMPESPAGNDEDFMTDEERLMQDTIEAIKTRLGQGYEDDGSYNAMIDEAYGGALGAIGNARNKANSNYAESDKVLEGLTAGHVNVIKGEDMDNIKRIGQANQDDLSGIYGKATGSLQEDRSREIAERGEMMQRLGLQESGMGDVGEVQNKAISNLTETGARAQQSARNYQAADETLNVARGQAAANEGVERRSSLRGDLDKILGTLDNSEATINSSKAQARLAAKQADRSAFDSSQRADADTLEMFLNQKREDRQYNEKAAAKEKGSATVNDLAEERFRARNIDPEPFKQAYSEVMAENRYSSVSGKDKNAHFVHEMNKKLQKRGVQLKDIEDWVSFKNGYGTDKGTATLG